ncbi:prepilin-type N-terminal cleavage/methylation domain-containing protein [Oceanobacillus sp. J11TS1]|uniref:prepilin-type N-terminal cleavage/methylation domain-containing protein n=1 Tax=Oceanobacillus sp. J11TS1 TaxID=2807191 RepID=UPI001B0C0990|nr:prepilin-type N-terminal cleavage/methylation domain-containing protein [Oceanobacillus sp. J11TS1]GIO23144.1 hypothetical protein J11TS1_17250 [Oceanobacillus sp. J11TS1]
MLQTERGFTLLEALFALSILSVILLLIPKHQMEHMENLENEQFLNTLEMDVLYLQNTMSTQEITKPYVLRFASDSYSILLSNETIIKREFPSSVILTNPYLKDIKFSIGGVTMNPQTILMDIGGEPYRIVFPFGKGRFYAEKR